MDSINYGGVMCLFTIDNGHRVLMGMRNPDYVKNQKRETSYECPGGKLEKNKVLTEGHHKVGVPEEKNETLAQGVCREIMEEFSLFFEQSQFEGLPYSSSLDTSVGKTNVIYVMHLKETCVRGAACQLQYRCEQDPSLQELKTIVSIDTNELIDSLLSGGKTPKFSAVYMSDQKEVEEQYPLRAFNIFLIRAAIKDGLLKKY